MINAIAKQGRETSFVAACGAMALILICGSAGCTDSQWNNPYPVTDADANTYYSTFGERPNHLDPARSYSSNEIIFTGQIYEPPLQYHYLKRPYQLEPLTLTQMPTATYLDKNKQPLPASVDMEKVAFTLYELKIKPGIRYQPHPAFARDEQDKLLYLNMTSEQTANYQELSDFEQTGTREMTAQDYLYQMKRLAHPKLHSPIFGLMANYIDGLSELGNELKVASENAGDDKYLDLREFTLRGVEVVDPYTYRIRIKGRYPQFLYWLAMPFFAPIPHEADRFYSQPGMKDSNIILDWYPVGTGPYMLSVNNPNRQMVMVKNPNFHGEVFPEEGEPEDQHAGNLRDAGKALPFVDRFVFSLEKESIPSWNKFLQGYYDASGIGSDSFDQAVVVSSGGEVNLSAEMQEKGMQLLSAVATTSFYMGFNMLDPVVGGYSDSARKIRQAISIAVDYEEFITIFRNGRGVPGQSPIPPGIFGYRAGKSGLNPYTYDWIDGKSRKKSAEEAKKLLAEAGYPNGQDAKTGKPLIIYFDNTATGPGSKAILDWWRKQFKKINLQLVIRSTTYNRFQDKIRKGTAQLFFWGWNADYPDPENFLFLLYGPNGKVKHQGENAANYNNPEFDRLFEKMKDMENGPDRQAVIDRMLEIARKDSPWMWGFHPKQISLHHQWVTNIKPNLMANNTLKYRRIEPQIRAEKRSYWNAPVIWPVLGLLVLLIVGTIPAIRTYRQRQQQAAIRS